MAINPNGSANNFFDHRNKPIIENIQKVSVKDQFEGIAEAFRQYQAEMAEQEQASVNPTPTELESETEAEKTEKKVATEKRVEGRFPENGVTTGAFGRMLDFAVSH